MKNTILGALLFLTICVYSTQNIQAQSAVNEKNAQGVTKIDEAVNNAMRDSDGGEMKRLLSDDFTYINSSGVFLEKNSYINEMKRAEIDSLTSRDIKVRVYGDAAVVTGRLNVMFKTSEGRRFLYTRTYIWNKDKWLLVAAQANPMKE